MTAEKLTPKERVTAALEHREPDRVPVGEVLIEHAVIDEALGRRFIQGNVKRRWWEAVWDGRRNEVVDSLKRDIVDYTLALGLDIVHVKLVPHKDFPFRRPKQLDEDTWEDEQGNILRYSHETEDIGLVKRGDGPASRPDLELPERPDESEMEVVRYVIEKLGKTHYIFGNAGRYRGPFYPQGWTAERFIRIADDPDGVAEAEIRAAESLGQAIEHVVDAGVDGILFVQEYGFNTGPFVSPETFARIYAPALKRRCEIVHERGLHFLLHSCGNNRIIMDQIVDAGIDAYQSIQPVERIHELKQLYGDRITLWGGVSTDTLHRGTPEEVRRQALFTLKYCAPGGGLILGASHSVGVKTPLANYRALVDTAHECGRYPIDIPEDVPEPEWEWT